MTERRPWIRFFSAFAILPEFPSKELRIMCQKVLIMDQLILIAIKHVNYISNRLCVKSICIRSFSGPCFPPFRLNTERYRKCLRLQSKCEKMQNRKTPDTDTFHSVRILRSENNINIYI